ncbi:MAG TPA: hypothetical protein VEY91_00405 [Candidatus Limnocylindria bacterium]|nr:hypothetical protein [Candidatus Limnocylindria bacterium]
MLKPLMLCGALIALAPWTAQAQTSIVAGVGPRVGFGVDPDQIVFGGQMIIGEVAPNLTFDPSLELGFGDHLTVISLNFDMHYHFAIQGSSWRPYAGGGVNVHFLQFDAPPGVRDDSETDVGGALVIGAGAPTPSGSRFFGELKFGLGDSYDIRGMVGWNFRI